MASKRKILTDPPANSSSSYSSGEEEDGSSSEEHTPQAQTPKSTPSKKPQSSAKTPSQPESSSEEGSDSETEPEPEPVSQKRSVAAKPNPASPPPPKSIATPNPASSPPPKSTKRASKSTDEGAKSSKRAKVADDPKSPPSQKPESSSEEETDSEKHSVSAKPNPASPPPPKSSKRAKVADASSKKPEDANKGPFERLWSEADEIALLNGMIQFEKERGMEVSKDVPGFFDIIEGSLQCKVKLSQLKDKMARLKKKFQNNKLKSGGEPKFASSHDQDCFDLSMSLWGSAGGLGESSVVKSRAESSRVRSRAVKKKSSIADVGGDNKLDSSDIALGNGQNGKQGNGPVELEKPSRVVGNVEEAATVQADSLRRHFLRSCVGAANMEEMVKSGLEMLQGRKKTELEERWTKLHVEQLELYLKNLDLLKEQSLLILEELKSSLVGKL